MCEAQWYTESTGVTIVRYLNKKTFIKNKTVFPVSIYSLGLSVDGRRTNPCGECESL